MKKTMFKWTAFIFLLFLNTVAKPVISYAVFKKGDKNVVLFGDLHYEAIDEINMNHISALLKTLKTRKNSIPIKFLVELEPNTIEILLKTKNLPKHVVGFGKITEMLLPYVIKMKNIKNVEFLPMDMRDYKISISVNTCIDEIYDSFLKNKNYPNNLIMFIKEVLYATEPNVDCMPSCHQYLEGLDRQEDNFKKWSVSYNSDSPEFEILNQKYARYQKSHEKIKEMLKIINKDANFFDALLKIVNTSPDCTVAMAFKNISDMREIMLDESDYLVQDAGLLSMILNEPNVITTMGQSHYKEIFKDLSSLGYKCLGSKSIYHFNDATLIGFIKDNPIFRNEIISALNVFDDKEISSSSSSKIEEENVERICSHCKKSEAESLEKKLLRCSRCQKAWYCNQACQKNDWAEHKRMCGPK